MKQLLYIDLFCGAGGTSTGVERAIFDGEKCAEVIACVNHDKNAIASHAANHPNAVHYTEDIRTLDLTELTKHVAKKRAENPNAFIVLWASLECTNFSNAKGGLPRDADSRTLAEHLFRYIDALDPDYIQIENVKEFMCWGDLDANGKPLSRDKGTKFIRWVSNVRSRGYDFSYRMLNSADFGAYTSRTRFFGIFAKGDLPIVFPEPTHEKNPTKGMFALKKWEGVYQVLELDNEGNTIFREKPLSEKTLARIYAGLIKFVAGGQKAFLSRYNDVAPKDTALSIYKPCGVLTTFNRFALTKVQFLSKQFSGDNNSKNISIYNPAGTLTCKDHHALMQVKFLQTYYNHGSVIPVDKPSPTVTPADRISMITSKFIDMQYGNSKPTSIDVPAEVVTAVPKHNIVTVRKFLMNPQYDSKGSSIDKPCFTLIARMDKMPPYIVTTDTGEVGIVIYKTDSPMTVKIKEFMSLYGISDIKMRMLNIKELKRIQGFGDDYILIGTQTEQKKYIGNAVEVNTARVLCESLYAALKERKINKVI